MNKNQSTGIIIIVAIILIALLSVAFEGPTTSTSEISYSQFLNKVQMKTIESVAISRDVLIATPKEATIQTETEKKEPINPLNINNTQQKTPKKQFRVQIPLNDDDLYTLLKENGVEITVSKPKDGSWTSVVGSVIIPIIFITIMIVLILKGIQQTGSNSMV